MPFTLPLRLNQTSPSNRPHSWGCGGRTTAIEFGFLYSPQALKSPEQMLTWIGIARGGTRGGGLSISTPREWGSKLVTVLYSIGIWRCVQ